MLTTHVCHKPSEPEFRKVSSFPKKGPIPGCPCVHPLPHLHSDTLSSGEAADQGLETPKAWKGTMASLPTLPAERWQKPSGVSLLSLPRVLAASKLVLLLLLLVVNGWPLLKFAL